MKQTQPVSRSKCRNRPVKNWGGNFTWSAIWGAGRYSRAIVLLLPTSSWNEAVFNLHFSFIRILSPLALESHQLASTTPLCFIITTVPGGLSYWNFLSLWINSGERTSASSSGIVPVSVWQDCLCGFVVLGSLLTELKQQCGLICRKCVTNQRPPQERNEGEWSPGRWMGSLLEEPMTSVET